MIVNSVPRTQDVLNGGFFGGGYPVAVKNLPTDEDFLEMTRAGQALARAKPSVWVHSLGDTASVSTKYPLFYDEIQHETSQCMVHTWQHRDHDLLYEVMLGRDANIGKAGANSKSKTKPKHGVPVTEAERDFRLALWDWVAGRANSPPGPREYFS